MATFLVSCLAIYIINCDEKFSDLGEFCLFEAGYIGIGFCLDETLHGLAHLIDCLGKFGWIVPFHLISVDVLVLPWNILPVKR